MEQLTGAVNGDNDGEHWRLTSPDGTRYHFGLNRLPGWSAGQPETGSVFNAPVFGNHSGEPCHSATATAAWCQQGYRWNLDYVVDRYGDAMSLWYTKETNNYGRWNGSPYFGQTTPYVRGGHLNRIDYGQRDGAVYGSTPGGRVSFAVADRCKVTGSSCTSSSSNWSNWPDVPWDENCASSCTYFWTPTFWTTKRLASVTTQVNTGGAFSNVESWTLRQSYPDPYPAEEPWGEENDASRSLWLNGITHTGLAGGSIALPEVKFTGVTLKNRHNGNVDYPSLYKFRVASITSEFGGITQITYASAECDGMPYIYPDQAASRCFPNGRLSSPYLGPDVFYKYVVNRVSEVDAVAGGTAMNSDYEYIGPAAWHYDDIEATASTDRTWNQWRGYEKVRVRTGSASAGGQTLAEHQFLRGMDDDKTANGRRDIWLTDSQGGRIEDRDVWRGQVRESVVFSATGGAPLVRSIIDPTVVATTASRVSAIGTLTANVVADRSQRRFEMLADGTSRITEDRHAYDGYGRLVLTSSLGDPASAADDSCLRVTYVSATSGWFLDAVARTEKVAVSCDATAAYPADLVRDIRYFHDGATVWGTPPSRGDVTRVEEATGYSGGPVYVTTARATYDLHGRATERIDALGNKETSAYTPSTGGPLTRVVTSNALGHTVTATVNPWHGTTESAIDVNNRRTELAHDPLGRLTAVWLPDRSRAGGASPSVKYDYLVRNNGPSAVTTWTLLGDGSYQASHELLDGLLRSRQIQEPSPAGGRIISEVIYDSAGRVAATNAPYWASGSPATTLVSVADASVPSQTRYFYDGSNRQTAAVLRSFGVEKWRTTNAYGGNWTSVDPPDGGTATMSIVDREGRPVELRQYHGGSPTGGYDAMKYAYTKDSQLASVTDAAGNVWRHYYDLRGRRIRTEDPDAGTSQLTYDAEGRLTSATDARGKTLAFTYDALDRRTAEFDGSTSGTKLAEWTYDAVGNAGLPAATVRYSGGQAYRTEVTGYDAAGRPTGKAFTIPGSELGLPGVFRHETRVGYNAAGQMSTVELPALGDLPAETLRLGRDGFGKVSSLSGQVSYLAAAAYTELGEPQTLTMGTASGQVMRDFGYDAATRRLSTATTRTASGTISAVAMAHDAAGNVTRLADSVTGDTQCFRHDHLRRLVEAWTPGAGDCAAAPAVAALGGPGPYWHSYRFDAMGNRLSEVHHAGAGDTTRAYAYPAAGSPQPHAVRSVTTSGPAGSRVDNYVYDAAGNTTARPGQTLTWDAEGHVASAGGTTFVYTADGDRLLRRDTTGTTVYFGSDELRKTSSGALLGTRQYEAGGMTLAVRTATKLHWLASDHHGTNVVAIDAATLGVSRRYHLPFGGARGSVPASWPSEKGFVGGTTDPTTGLTHLGAREYDPALGRFLSVDPEVDVADPQSLAAYGYAGNSPVTFSDPDGRRKQDPGKPNPYKHCGGSKKACDAKQARWERMKLREAERELQAEVDKLKKAIDELNKRMEELLKEAKKHSKNDKSFWDKLGDFLKNLVKSKWWDYAKTLVTIGTLIPGVNVAATALHVAMGAVEIGVSAATTGGKMKPKDAITMLGMLGGVTSLFLKVVSKATIEVGKVISNFARQGPERPAPKIFIKIAEKIDKLRERLDVALVGVDMLKYKVGFFTDEAERKRIREML